MSKIAARKAAKERKNTFFALCLLVPLASVVGLMVLSGLMGIGFVQMGV